MNKFEFIFIPTSNGTIKIYSYGFLGHGSPGKVYATFNDLVVSSKGYNRKRTIVKALSKLNEIMASQE